VKDPEPPPHRSASAEKASAAQAAPEKAPAAPKGAPARRSSAPPLPKKKTLILGTPAEAPPAPAAPAKTHAEQAADALIGTVISDRYRIIELLAMGGMGAVFRGEHLLLRKRVAIKVLHPETNDFPEHVTRFEREAMAGAHIQHPNVASATDFGRLADGSYFLVLEFIHGVTLDQLIKEGPIEAPRAAGIARQLAAALDAAHMKGVIHRDVKPRNVMLEHGRSDLVKLIDFGLAKVPLDRLSATGGDAESSSRHRALTLTGVVFGTIAYIAPEAAFGMDAVEARSDLYAVGIILYEMLGGKHPFDAIDPTELFEQQRSATPPPLRLRSPGIDVPRELEAITTRLLRKDPAQRFASARMLMAALDAAMPPAEAAGLISWKTPLPMSVAGAIAASIAGPAQLEPVEAAHAQVTHGAASEAPPAATPTNTKPSRQASPYTPRFGAGRRSGGAAWWVAGTALGAAAVAGGLYAWMSWPREARLQQQPLPVAPVAPVAPEVSATAPAPSAEDTAAPATSPSPAPADRRGQLVRAAALKDWQVAEQAFLALAEHEPAAFQDRDVMTSAAQVAVKSAFRNDATSERIMTLLSTDLGTDGLDVLYEMASGHGGTKGADRAAEILRRPQIRARATPALRIAVELREAPCQRKEALFERASKEGDARSLVVLELLRSPQCQPRIGQCCFHNNTAIQEAVTTLRSRLR
jgi:serine/threonine-protein kinase